MGGYTNGNGGTFDDLSGRESKDEEDREKIYSL